MTTIAVFEELKHLIVQSGIPPTRLARQANVTFKTLDDWLNGTVQLPRIDTMLKVARIVGKEMELTGNVRKMVTYYGPSVPQPPPQSPPPFKLRPYLWRL